MLRILLYFKASLVEAGGDVRLLAAVKQLVPAYALTSPADTGSHMALSGSIIDLMISGQVVPSCRLTTEDPADVGPSG